MLKMDDFSRQVNVFNPNEFKTPIHIIGAGATGAGAGAGAGVGV